MGVLYVVATPIGNMGDLSPRALEVLGKVSLIAAEDTRVSGMMLDRLGIKKPMVSYHKFNEKEKSENIIDKLQTDGYDVALVTDAGTPCISDPGSVLVREAVDNGITVVGIPGASAVSLALSVSGFDTTSFAFYGFFPRNKKEQKEFCQRIQTDSIKCAVFYESPKRILKTIQTLTDEFENEQICVCNDLTKKFEKIYRGTPQSVLTELEENEKNDLGEYAVVIEKSEVAQREEGGSTVSVLARLFDLYISGKSIKDAVEVLTKDGIPRNEAYSAGLELKKILK